MGTLQVRKTAGMHTQRSVRGDSRPNMLTGANIRRASERWCEACYRPILGGVVNRGASEYCSIECALGAAVPGRYLG